MLLVFSTTTASADISMDGVYAGKCREHFRSSEAPIPTPSDISSTVADVQTSRGNSRDLPAYTCRLYVVAFRASIGL